ncbi:MAG: GTP-binding protein, partial [Clostridiales bacterium]|nr:GTP-binding protein [Clostridiales bacterium]
CQHCVDIVFLNKTDNATEELIVASKEIINIQRPDIAVLETSFGEFQMVGMHNNSG